MEKVIRELKERVGCASNDAIYFDSTNINFRSFKDCCSACAPNAIWNVRKHPGHEILLSKHYEFTSSDALCAIYNTAIYDFIHRSGIIEIFDLETIVMGYASCERKTNRSRPLRPHDWTCSNWFGYPDKYDMFILMSSDSL